MLSIIQSENPSSRRENKKTNQIYINKQTNNIHINKQTIAKAGFNPHSIKISINVKTIFKNIFDNLIQILLILKYS